MRTTTKIITAAGILTAVTLGTVAVTAAWAHDGPPRHARGFFAERLADLGTTPAQREQIRTILRKHQPTVQPLVKQLVAERRQLRATIRAATVDEKAIRAQSAKVAAIEADLAVERARIVHEVRPVLTADQIEKLQDLQGDADERVDHFLSRVAKRIAAD